MTDLENLRRVARISHDVPISNVPPEVLREVLQRMDTAEQAVARVREVCVSDAHDWTNEYGSNEWVTVENILEALDGEA